MNRIFREFENENALRTYPFASGCVPIDTDGAPIGTGILVDATIYPVNSRGIVYLSGISSGGVVSISDETGVIMTAVRDGAGDTLEFFETGGLGRHVGTVLASSPDALSALTSGTKARRFRPNATAFAASCLFPIENDGVLSLDVGGTGATDGIFEFANGDDDEVRISTDKDGRTLRFDVLPHPTSNIPKSIRKIYCIVDGRTPFRIEKIGSGIDGVPGNTIAVYLDNIDKSAVCGNAHRENALEMADTCDCRPDVPEPVEIPPELQVEVVDIPDGADSAFYLAVPNLIGYDNPLSITLDDGIDIPKTELKTETDPAGRMAAKDAMVDKSTAKGVILQVPGLSGGQN